MPPDEYFRELAITCNIGLCLSWEKAEKQIPANLSNLYMLFYHSASVDYIPRGPFDITFEPGSRRKLFNVTIVDDAMPESSEFFNADIVSVGPAGVIIGEPRQPVIEIRDRVDSK